MSRIAYLDCPSGVAGDMLLGALLDAGVPQKVFQDVATRLELPDVTISAAERRVRGFRAIRVDVSWDTAAHADHRHLPAIDARIEAGGFPEAVRDGALAVFRTLAEAEARVHGKALDDVHFHEVGAVDAMVDIVGVAAGLHHLGVTGLRASPLPMGRGTVRCAHGELPLPAPAVAQMLQGVPVYGVDAEGETVTPTGLALLKGLGATFGTLPPMTVTAVGCGAGHRELPLPGPLRLFVGEDDALRPGSLPEAPHWERAVVVAANIDDMNPQHYDLAFERLFAAGARDVWVAPIVMKKGRPAHRLAALTTPEQVDAVAAVMLRETTTIGVRVHEVSKWALPREMVEVQTSFGTVPVKIVRWEGKVLRAIPEHDAIRALAVRAGVAIIDVAAAARRACDDHFATLS